MTSHTSIRISCGECRPASRRHGVHSERVVVLHTVDIRYSKDEMLRNRRRLESAYRFDFFNRVPVLLGIEPRYLLDIRGVSFREYFADSQTQLLHQLENIKWRIENIPDDWFNEPKITVSPDFQNVTNASGCGCEIFWQETETPQAIQRLSTIEEMERHQLPEWRNSLWGKKLEWFIRMKELAGKIDVRLNGERIPVDVTIGINGDSPFMSAVELAGANFYGWLLEAPALCHDLLRRITDRYIEVEEEYRSILGRPMKDGLNYSDDSAQVISLSQYREFCVPVAKRLYETFGCDRHDGRIMHLCGRNVHLHEALLHDLHITLLHGYGSANAPDEMSTLAGKTVMIGNIDPLTLYQGSESDVEQETSRILEILAARGGIILGDGYNVVPGTSLSNMEVVRKTS